MKLQNTVPHRGRLANIDKSISFFLAILQFDPEPGVYIVRGIDAPDGSHPHMVALTNSGEPVGRFTCGGSLISRRTVLTAAHCITAVFVNGSLSSYLRVTVGTNYWNTGGQTYSVTRYVMHQHYNPATYTNDIGLLITASNVEFSKLVRPIQLSYDDILGGVHTKVTGWGRTEDNGYISEPLQELQATTISGQECIDDVKLASEKHNETLKPIDPLIEICTAHRQGYDTCSGDSGSPLTRVSDGKQIGVLSWGFKTCGLGAPDVYVRISAYKDWIQEHIVV
ncbi:Serine protease 33 [Operophtera brumata]|uniref:Serine protease 33 n=1 Tax=Operophtera brumata TaxID=104452 RepID=A0A0L7LAZ5_OPEBR|nr:Serine protease 33 [Operophtera brumata]